MAIRAARVRLAGAPRRRVDGREQQGQPEHRREQREQGAAAARAQRSGFGARTPAAPAISARPA
jgi:hypothetical protein